MTGRLAGLLVLTVSMQAGESPSWPPVLRDADNGIATITTPVLLQPPAATAKAAGLPGATPYVVATSVPRIEFSYYQNLPPAKDAGARSAWSSWGDICVASDGRVYAGIGNNETGMEGQGRCVIYRWDPSRPTFGSVIDMNQVIPSVPGRPSWNMIHSRIDEAANGRIYFSCTLGGNMPAAISEEDPPGGQLYEFDPSTGTTTVFARLLPQRRTRSSTLDREHNRWWCTLHTSNDQILMFGLDLTTKTPMFQSADNAIGYDRNFAVTRAGTVLCNGIIGGVPTLLRCAAGELHAVPTTTTFTRSPGFRCSTRETRAGFIYGVLDESFQIFRYDVAKDVLTLLGPCWLTGEYTASCALSPDERFLYFIPGARGSAPHFGTVVVQYNVANGQRKAVAFLREACEQLAGYTPTGTFGVAMDATGETLYVNFNGRHFGPQGRDAVRGSMLSFSLPAFAAIHIPATER